MSTNRSPESILSQAQTAEKQLIRRFRELKVERFIGSSAGEEVSQLPSAAYWSALKRWGIVRADVDRNHAGEAIHEHSVAQQDGIAEFPIWHAGLPPAPAGFPGTETQGIELNRVEAEWIRDRILATVPDTMLAQLAAAPELIVKSNNHPWKDPAAMAASAEAAAWLNHARAFSALLNSLEALYSVRVTAERRRQFDEEAQEDDAAVFEESRADEQALAAIENWNVHHFITMARTVNPRIKPGSVSFLTEALEQLRSGSDPLHNKALHAMIREREKRAKGANSRFLNKRRLRDWTAPSRVPVQTFRWTQVRNMMVDLREGLDRA